MSDQPLSFSELNLDAGVLKALNSLGYEEPSPIQAACIPALLEGQDVLGTAQTGTGKTAAFALPALQRLNLKQTEPQVLVLTPTRELAIQVAEAFQSYARFLKGFHVLPIYGGQGFGQQLKQLDRGPHVIVGTPGRILDHLRRRSLRLETINTLVLDEADEMLRMGFIEDVETIMAEIPEAHQTALFSATMPEQIRRISKGYMQDPVEIKIAAKTSTVERITQQYWRVAGVNKIDALSRLLESETYDGVIVFTRTKTATVELAERLEARGYAAAALNGDMSQVLRERTVNNLKNNKLDILIATDVAARGLDVERLDLVINYDIPYDTEAYVHRIGRTGRAGRTGKAILFVTNREQRLLKAIEKATRQTITPIGLPSNDELTQKRIDEFKKQILRTHAEEPMDFYQQLGEQLSQELELDYPQLAGALIYLAQKERPLQLPDEPAQPSLAFDQKPSGKNKRGAGADGDVSSWDLYRIEVGRNDNVQIKHIVGAIANEADISSRFIGNIKMHDSHTTVELPEGMPEELLAHLKKVKICGKSSDMSLQEKGTQSKGNYRKKPKSGGKPSKAPANKRKPRKREKPAGK